MRPHAIPEPGRRVDVLIAEYDATQNAYLHYDGFRWQAGSFLIAGVFIFWGLFVQQRTYREIYMYKLRRLHEIELELGMEQHLRFRRDKSLTSLTHRVSRPRGHELDMAVYLLTVLGTPLLAAARDAFSWWYLASLPVMVVALYLARGSERAAQAVTRLQLVGGTHSGSLPE
jgi:hypothetical protein